MCRDWLGNRPAVLMFFAAVACGSLPHRSLAADDSQIRTLVDGAKYAEAIELLVKETSENPADESSRMMLAEAYDKAGNKDQALAAWQDLAALSRSADNLSKARRAIAVLRRIQLDQQDLAATGKTDSAHDPFKIPMPDVDFKGLEVVEDTKYLPAIFPPPLAFEVPPLIWETEHFTVYSTNERLSKVIGDRAEVYLDFMVDKLFRGRSFPVRFPILVYASEQDYLQHGAPEGSHGVTKSTITGKTLGIFLFQLRPDDARGGSSPGRGRSGSGRAGGELYQYAIESILPHELTHAIIIEFFGGQETPRWLHEAVAGRFEQTRDHYGEAARLSRQVVAGEYFRMRDLFTQKNYPERIGLFYEQSAAVVLYLFEAGPDAMYSFLSELAAGHEHDAACAAALGIPENGAVEEFERRWVEWMRRRYVRDLDRAADSTQTASADKSNHALFLPWVNELDTTESISTWREIDLTSLQPFRTPVGYQADWKVADGMLRCGATAESGPSLLALRMNEVAPVTISCEVRFLGSPGDTNRSFGFTQMDAEGFDMRVEALTTLRDNTAHKVVCIWSDDLALYVDGVCTGRYPSVVSAGPQDIDYPLALFADGPVEVQGLKVAVIKNFSTKPVVAKAEPAPESRPQPQDQPRRSREDRRRKRDEKKEP